MRLKDRCSLFQEAGTDSDEDALQYSPYHKKRYDRSPRSEILVEEKERSREVGGEEEFTIFSITPLDLAKQLCILDKHNIESVFLLDLFSISRFLYVHRAVPS